MTNTDCIYSKPSFSNGIKLIPILVILIILSAFWFIESILFTYIGFVVIVFSIISLLFLYRIKYKEFYAFIALIVSMLIFKTLSGYITNNLANFGLYISLITGVVLSYLAFNYDKHHFILKSFYYFTFLYAVIVFVVLLLGRDPNEIWRGSRNASSQLFVILGSLFLIYTPVIKKLKYQLFFYFIIFIICVLSMGRSGILTSFILLISAMLQNYSSKLTKKYAFTLAVSAFVFLIAISNVNYFLDFFNNYSGFDYLRTKGVEDSYRSIMIEEFFSSYSFKVFLFGIDLSTLPYIASFNNNPHNGFIYLHAKLGILALVFYAGILWLVLKLLIKKEMVALAATLAMLFRFSTDLPSGIILVPLMFLFLYSFYTESLELKRLPKKY